MSYDFETRLDESARELAGEVLLRCSSMRVEGKQFLFECDHPTNEDTEPLWMSIDFEEDAQFIVVRANVPYAFWKPATDSARCFDERVALYMQPLLALAAEFDVTLVDRQLDGAVERPDYLRYRKRQTAATDIVQVSFDAQAGHWWLGEYGKAHRISQTGALDSFRNPPSLHLEGSTRLVGVRGDRALLQSGKNSTLSWIHTSDATMEPLSAFFEGDVYPRVLSNLLWASADDRAGTWKCLRLTESSKPFLVDVRIVAFFEDLALVQHEDDRAQIVELPSLRVRHELSTTVQIVCAALAPDAQTIALAGGDKRMRIYDLTTGASLLDKSGAGVVRQMAYLENSNVLVSISANKSVKVWLPNGKGKTLRGHEQSPHSLAVGADVFITASRWNACVWSASDYRLVGTLAWTQTGEWLVRTKDAYEASRGFLGIRWWNDARAVWFRPEETTLALQEGLAAELIHLMR